MLSHSKAVNVHVPFATGLTIANSVARRPNKWKCPLAEMLVGEYLIVPLTSAKMLKSESCRMNNGCREYIDQCAALTYGLFSIRKRSGERLATLGLACHAGHWRFDQCAGPSNAEVLEESRVYLDEEGELQEEVYATELYYVAQEVARLMNAAGWQTKAH